MPSTIEHFYWHPLTLAYEFGPRHPLRPERLRRALTLFREVLGIEPVLASPSSAEALEAIHDPAYVDAIRRYSQGERDDVKTMRAFGIGTQDCPPFSGMFESSLAYMGCAEAAARAVLGGARRGYNIAGGLHHARRAQAAGFCIFNDPAWACTLLRERFSRVAYVDLDVHHGEGVQYAFAEDPTVMTCSIHQDGKTLFPGTGFLDEHGPSYTALNVPLAPGTSGDVWLWAFRNTILPALERFQPDALVVQCGTDAHVHDPLARLQVRAQDWLAAVRDLHELNLPTVVLGGGGYNISVVPRLWLGAVCTFAEMPIPEQIPEPFASDWDMPTVFDPDDIAPLGGGRESAERVVELISSHHLPNIRTEWA